MQLTEYHKFACTLEQKQTLRTLHKKYNINTSQFIRDAINEKLLRERNNLVVKFKEVQDYLDKMKECPF